jgi:beta-phosphoglucomutase
VIEGVLFDMDGVIVDSERFICEAAIRMFAELGVAMRPEDFVPFIGAGEDRYIGGPAERHGVQFDLPKAKARTYAIYGDVIRGKLEPLPGAIAFVKECRRRRLKTALASSADRIKVEQNLNEIGLPESSFDTIVCGTDIARKKPDPEIFQTAAGRLCLDPGHCLVVEDAVNGVKAARAAGARCLGITGSFGAEQLRADWHAADLAHAPDECLDW